MTLRLNETQSAALRERASAEGRSMHQTALRAIEEYTSTRPARLRAIVERVVDEDAELLERLSR